MTAGRDVLAVRLGGRVTTKSESFLNYFLYGEPDAKLGVDYFFWIIRDSDDAGTGGVTLVDAGFAPEVGERRGRTCESTPVRALRELGIDPEEVRTVVVTHAHWDHIGNLHQFPHAEIVISQAEYDFWTGPVARRTLFAAFAEPAEIARLTAIRDEGRLTFVTGRHALAPGIELIEVGGHTPGELIVAVSTAAGQVILTSDAMHHYEEVERDRPYHILADLHGMYLGYELLRELASQPRTWLVAGHDPEVRNRFARYANHPAVTDLGVPRV